MFIKKCSLQANLKPFVTRYNGRAALLGIRAIAGVCCQLSNGYLTSFIDTVLHCANNWFLAWLVPAL